MGDEAGASEGRFVGHGGGARCESRNDEPINSKRKGRSPPAHRLSRS